MMNISISVIAGHLQYQSHWIVWLLLRLIATSFSLRHYFSCFDTLIAIIDAFSLLILIWWCYDDAFIVSFSFFISSLLRHYHLIIFRCLPSLFRLFIFRLFSFHFLLLTITPFSSSLFITLHYWLSISLLINISLRHYYYYYLFDVSSILLIIDYRFDYAWYHYHIIIILVIITSLIRH